MALNRCSRKRDLRRTPGPMLVLAWLLGFLGAIVAAACMLGASYVAASRGTARLERAAGAAVAHQSASAGSAAVVVGDRTVRVPLGLGFDRRRAILLAMESERLRRQAVAAFEALAGGSSDEGAGVATAMELAATFVFARQRMEQYLKVESPRARVLLYALGWPWPDDAGAGQSLAEFTSPRSAWPSPLTALPAARREGLMAAAEDAPAWPAAQEMLVSRFGLTDGQAFALRAHMCRRALAEAFSSRQGMKQAREALGKYVDLTPAQADAALAMAGALELARAGLDAYPVLEAMSRDGSQLAATLLQELKKDASRRPEWPANDVSDTERKDDSPVPVSGRVAGLPSDVTSEDQQ